MTEYEARCPAAYEREWDELLITLLHKARKPVPERIPTSSRVPARSGGPVQEGRGYVQQTAVHPRP